MALSQQSSTARERNFYEDGVDFVTLAAQDEEFRDKLKSNGQLDFSDPESVLLNYILWLQDLLDSTSPNNYRDGYDPDRKVVGVDVGTGASAIYPLLATRQRPNWRFVATECDDKSFQYARANVARNGLADRIHVFKTTQMQTKRDGTDERDMSGDGDRDGFLVPLDLLERFERIDFVQTNPPFYTSAHEHVTSSKRKSRPPNSACTGSTSEMITMGGEIGFVSRLISQSCSLRQSGMKDKVQWWSSMLGKLSSVGAVVERLKKEGCGNWAVGEFVQGGKTRRWVVAWSWMALRPSISVARGVKSKVLKVGTCPPVVRTLGQSGVGALAKRQQGWNERMSKDGNDDEDVTSSTGLESGGLLPFPSGFEFALHQDAEMKDVSDKVNHELSQLSGIQWQWKPRLAIGLGIALDGDCWSRKARRRMKGRLIDDKEESRARHEDDDNESHEGDEEPQLSFKIQLRPHHQEQQQQSEEGGLPESRSESTTIVVMVRWLEGRDHVLFESFCGWLKRKLDLDRR